MDKEKFNECNKLQEISKLFKDEEIKKVFAYYIGNIHELFDEDTTTLNNSVAQTESLSLLDRCEKDLKATADGNKTEFEDLTNIRTTGLIENNPELVSNRLKETGNEHLEIRKIYSAKNGFHNTIKANSKINNYLNTSREGMEDQECDKSNTICIQENDAHDLKIDTDKDCNDYENDKKSCKCFEINAVNTRNVDYHKNATLLNTPKSSYICLHNQSSNNLSYGNKDKSDDISYHNKNSIEENEKKSGNSNYNATSLCDKFYNLNIQFKPSKAYIPLSFSTKITENNGISISLAKNICKFFIHYNAEYFYFNTDIKYESIDQYYKNLVKLDYKIIVDDIIIEKIMEINLSVYALNKFHKNQIADIGERTRDTLCRLYYMLKYKNFDKKTLKFIFDNLVYSELYSYPVLNCYRYMILKAIMFQYNNPNEEDEIKQEEIVIPEVFNLNVFSKLYKSDTLKESVIDFATLVRALLQNNNLKAKEAEKDECVAKLSRQFNQADKLLNCYNSSNLSDDSDPILTEVRDNHKLTSITNETEKRTANIAVYTDELENIFKEKLDPMNCSLLNGIINKKETDLINKEYLNKLISSMENKNHKSFSALSYKETKNSETDNIFVLSNIIWESMIPILKNIKHIGLSEKFLYCDILCYCIKTTGPFFQNRFAKNTFILQVLKESNNFTSLLECIIENFHNYQTVLSDFLNAE